MHRSPTRVRTVLISLALVTSSMVAASLSAGAAISQAEGIDVSHWQGTINWSSVAGAGKTFAFLKATQGTTYRDPTYATNRANANAVGIPTGAYHFADGTPKLAGARAEAEWFVSVAQPRAGDLPPVFDIEDNFQLGQSALTDWTMEWLERVRQLTGIYPMVYTSPSGWNTRFGASGSIVAESGYGLLWIAHWDASSPTVPANNWAGRGWTFWQYTSDGSVAGISGRVDLDRYRYSSVSSLLLRQLTISKVSVAGKIGGVQQDGLGAFCNAACLSTTRFSVGGATTTLAPQSMDANTTWTWGGACAGSPVGGTCTLSMTEDRAVTITYKPITAPITVAAAGTGSGSVTSDATGISCTSTAGVASGTCTASFAYDSSVILTATATAGSAFTGWSGACGGTGTCSVTANAAKEVTATFQPSAGNVTLTVARSGMGTGSVTPSGGTACTSSCTSTYPVGTTLTVAQSAASGSVFVGWTGGTCTGTGTCSVTMDAARSVTGWFAPLYSRTVSLRASSTRVAAGTTVTISGAVGTSNAGWCPVGDQTVTVTVGSNVVGTTKTTINGTWSIPITPSATATYVARLARTDATTLGNPVCGAANSSSVKVTVR